jgi:hypothetical protein
MAIGIGSKVRFKDGDPPDIGVVLDISSSSVLRAAGIYDAEPYDPNEIWAAVKFPRFPRVQGWTYHRISCLVEVSE